MADERDRPIVAVLTDIVGNVQQIIRAEIRLASVEARREAAKAARSAALLIVGSALTVLALAFLLLGGVYALGTVVAPWMASLIVAIAAGVVGGTLIALGTKQIQHQVATPPSRTVATIQENVQWAKASIR